MLETFEKVHCGGSEPQFMRLPTGIGNQAVAVVVAVVTRSHGSHNDQYKCYDMAESASLGGCFWQTGQGIIVIQIIVWPCRGYSR